MFGSSTCCYLDSRLTSDKLCCAVNASPTNQHNENNDFFCPFTAEFTNVAEQAAEMSAELAVPFEGLGRSKLEHCDNKG